MFNFQPPATEDEIHAAELQSVRKEVGTTRPSKDNEAPFSEAVAAIMAVTRELVRERLSTRAAPRPRETLAAHAKEHGRKRELRIVSGAVGGGGRGEHGGGVRRGAAGT